MTNLLTFKTQPRMASLLAACLVSTGLLACGGKSDPPNMVLPDTPTAVQLVVPSAAASTPGLVVTGSSSTTTATSTTIVSIRDMIEALEKSGTAPPLDRSSDIKGPDVNNNGVRDDIEAYINLLPLTPKQIKALMQDARINQLTLTTDVSDKAALQRVGEASMAAGKCLADSLSGYYPLSRKIEAMTANTRERVKQYMAYNSARSGSSTTMPSGDTCEK